MRSRYPYRHLNVKRDGLNADIIGLHPCTTFGPLLPEGKVKLPDARTCDECGRYWPIGSFVRRLGKLSAAVLCPEGECR